MAEQPRGETYFGSDEGRFATTQDEERLRGESAPPALTEESGTPRFAKGRAPAEHRASTHHLTEHEREERASSQPSDQEYPDRGPLPPDGLRNE